MCPSEERYYVKEHAGYRINPVASTTNSKAQEITEVMVLDRDYCHRVVWSSETACETNVYEYPGVTAAGNPCVKRYNRTRTLALQPLAYRREVAARLCAELNAEDRANAA